VQTALFVIAGIIGVGLLFTIGLLLLFLYIFAYKANPKRARPKRRR